MLLRNTSLSSLRTITSTVLSTGRIATSSFHTSLHLHKSSEKSVMEMDDSNFQSLLSSSTTPVIADFYAEYVSYYVVLLILIFYHILCSINSYSFHFIISVGVARVK